MSERGEDGLMRKGTVAAVLLALAGCGMAGCGGRPEPTMAHGKPVAHWVQSLQDPDARVRKRAADVMGNIGAVDPTIVPALAAAVKDRDRSVREAAVLALLKMGAAAKEATPALDEASKDSDARIRSYAAKALQKIRESP